MSKVPIQLDELLTEVKEASIGKRKINEIELNKTVTLVSATRDTDTKQAQLHLKCDKGRTYDMYLKSFAGIRLSDSSVKTEWSTDLKANPDIYYMQDHINKVNKLEAGMVIKVHSHVKILDNINSSGDKQVPQLEMRYYNKYVEYQERLVGIRSIADEDKRIMEYQAARLELYKSGVTNEEYWKDTDKIQYVPVFSVV